MSQSASKETRSLLALASQTVIYGFGEIGRRLIVYFSIPLLTAHMAKESFGAVAVLISLMAIFDVISNAGLPAATFRLYNDNDDPENHRTVLGSALPLFIIFATLLGIAVWIAADRIAVGFLGDARYIPAVRVTSILLLCITLIRYVQIILRIQVRPKAKVTLDVVMISAQTGLALLLVIVYGLEAFGYWTGQLAGGALALLLGYFLIRGTVSYSFSRQRAKELLHFSLPLLPAAIGLWGLGLADRSLITANLGLTETAVYEVGYKVGMITGLVIGPFMIAWPQFAFSRMHSPDAPNTYRNVLTAMAASAIFLAIFVISFRNELVAMMAPADYAAAAIIVPWIALSQVAWALYPIFSIGPKIAKNTMLLAMVTFLACTVNVGMNLLLIPRIGILGAAIATFVGYWVLAIVAYIVGNKHFPMTLDWRRLIQVAAAACMALLVTTQVAKLLTMEWQRILLQISGLAIYPAVLLLIGFISLDQVRQFLQFGLLRVRTVMSR